jgi:hypothetical protein
MRYAPRIRAEMVHLMVLNLPLTLLGYIFSRLEVIINNGCSTALEGSSLLQEAALHDLFLITAILHGWE